MKKNVVRIGVAVVLLVGGLFVYNQFFRQGVEGSKEVQIILTVDQEGEEEINLPDVNLNKTVKQGGKGNAKK